MIQIAHKLWVGNQQDFDNLDAGLGTEWAVVFAARDPWHRKELGYTGRGAPPDHPEYLFARRDDRLMLNLVDAQDPKYIRQEAIDEAMRFIEEYREKFDNPNDPRAVMIVCNQGLSRSPTLALLYKPWPATISFEDAVAEFLEAYPAYAPGAGMREFARANWGYYRARAWGATMSVGVQDDPLDIALNIWHRFCESLKTDPALARDQLIQSIVQALSAAEQQDRSHHGKGSSSAPD
jgi:hypothetical protein